MSRHTSPTVPLRNTRQQYPEYKNSDPIFPGILADLLSSHSQWSNIPDIVKLSFKAVHDLLIRQTDSIHEMERSLMQRATKSELNNGLAVKANVSDVSKTVQEVAKNIQSRATIEELNHQLIDKVSKNDIQFLLTQKASIDQVRSLFDQKASQNQINMELNHLSTRIQQIHRECIHRFNESPNTRDFSQLKHIVESKADLADMQQSLGRKANKETVSSALSRKANRAQVDSILAAKADTRDIQKLFQSLHDKVDVSHFDSLSKSLEDKLNISANKNDIDMYVTAAQTQRLQLESRIQVIQSEMNKLLGNFHKDMKLVEDQVTQMVSRKADGQDIQHLNMQINKKVDYDHLNALISQTKTDVFQHFSQFKSEASLQRRKDEDILIEKSKHVEKLAEKAFEQSRKITEQMRNLNDERRADVDETARFIKNVTQSTKQELVLETNKLISDLERLKRDIDQLEGKKADKRDLADQRQKMVAALEPKVDLSQVQTALTNCQTSMANRLSDFKDQIKQQFRHLQACLDDMYKSIDKKADFHDVQNALSLKADSSSIIQSTHAKANAADLESLKVQVDRMGRDVQSKAELRDFEGYIQDLRGNFDQLSKNLQLKSNISDVAALLDTKAGIEDVNKALTQVHKELDLKSNSQEITTSLNDQALINEALCAENCVARWIWKTGQVKSGYAVPWEVQSVNTCPDNFLWEKEKTSILTVAPGLYEVMFGFFAKKKPTVQLLVNGEPVLSAVNSASYVVHHSSGKLKNTGKHSAGNVTGLTLIDFIALPARARVSISYSGDVGAEGFLGLRKL